MEAFLMFSGQKLKKTTITLQALWLKINSLKWILYVVDIDNAAY